MKDWLIRAIKTFVQAFFGVLIPEFALVINNGWPEDWSHLWMALSPILVAALSAAICAVWNILNEAMMTRRGANDSIK